MIWPAVEWKAHDSNLICNSMLSIYLQTIRQISLLSRLFTSRFDLPIHNLKNEEIHSTKLPGEFSHFVCTTRNSDHR
ncbi:hypothetical protein ACH3XW_50385 [Acanthocheilonema viteae]